MPPPTLDTPRHSIAFARARDARICWLLEMHPVTAVMLVRLQWFPSKYKALKRLNRLVRRKRIRLVGTICCKPGRPENVYCHWTPKRDQLLHELELTELCFRLDAERILRGPHIRDRDIRPDAEVWIKGMLYYVEWDRGTMSYTQIVRDRFAKYAQCPHVILWVCSTELRREGLRQRAESLRHSALFATAYEALDSPHRTIWVDYRGQRAALPRHGEVGKKPGN